MSIKVLLADDQALVRGALAALLGLERDIDVVGEVGRGDEVLAAVRRTGAEVALLDIEMPGMSGIDVAEQLSREEPSCRALVVTTFGRAGYVRRALEAGARGFVVKDTPASELAEAVRRVHSGLRVIDPTLAAESLYEGVNPLSPREREVLREALTGAPVASIAAQVYLSPGTVRNHLSSAIGKTGTTTRMEAARVAQDNGWL
ncbi:MULTISPECIES: response regulator transcription factor [Janibacter]|uniref:Response regulator n=1 Tax=Janibacter melonis TaxID=262209 RepID=A0A176QE75_9MICO|nr:response regulator transcription factor [Janibacter melonis]MBD5830975.1 DNA-binding response regulator [Janibacter melonis]MCM3554052.1 response regulator transcription factor [Janibacter melonis]OAB87940.1 two-component system response regulator [Janibacter melonis]QFQ29836.1 response regulator [Janibacter melonis]